MSDEITSLTRNFDLADTVHWQASVASFSRGTLRPDRIPRTTERSNVAKKQAKDAKTKEKQGTVAAPPGEPAHGADAKGMSEGDPAALSHHPAREAAIHAASEALHDASKATQGTSHGDSPGHEHATSKAVHEQAARVRGARKGTGTKASAKKAGGDAALRQAAAAAALSPDLPEMLRVLASDDRVTVRRDGAPDPQGKAVVYWMQRAERAFDNPALDVAIAAADALGLPVVVYFAGISNFPHGVLRGYLFLNEGLRDVAEDCKKRNVTFVLRNAPHEDHLKLFADVGAAMVVGDENPMREPERWRKHVADHLQVPFWTVDADVIVPSKRFDKAQYAAYTMRGRLWKMVPEYLQPSANAKAKHAWTKPHGFQEDDPQADMTVGWKSLDRSVGHSEGLIGGAHAARARLTYFVEKQLPSYAHNRNHPDLDGTSKLSPYLHFGHISPLTIYLAIEAAVEKNSALRESADSFLDELVTWRELSINWVKFDPNYDNPGCAEAWAQKTVEAHAKDARDPVYTREQMERAETYDELWNAAQRQMVRCGWMHNFMRMYWGKKVLEWSADNASAMETLIYLNDKYFVDGRDPSGYAGIAWAIYGKFDRPWGERKVFGKIRYMSEASTGKKFNSKAYIAQNPPLDLEQATPAVRKQERPRTHRAKGQYGA